MFQSEIYFQSEIKTKPVKTKNITRKKTVQWAEFSEASRGPVEKLILRKKVVWESFVSILTDFFLN